MAKHRESKLDTMIFQLWIAAGCPAEGIVYNGISHPIIPAYREWILQKGIPTENDKRAAAVWAAQLEKEIAAQKRRKERAAQARSAGAGR